MSINFKISLVLESRAVTWFRLRIWRWRRRRSEGKRGVQQEKWENWMKTSARLLWLSLGGAVMVVGWRRKKKCERELLTKAALLLGHRNAVEQHTAFMITLPTDGSQAFHLFRGRHVPRLPRPLFWLIPKSDNFEMWRWEGRTEKLF